MKCVYFPYEKTTLNVSSITYTIKINNTVPKPTSVCHNAIFKCIFTWKQRMYTGTTFP